MSDDYGIEKRTVTIPQGEIVVSVTTESDGDAMFPVPKIERMPCKIVGHDCLVQFDADPRESFEKPLFSRGFELQDIVSFYDLSNHRIGYVYIEDGHPVEADTAKNLKVDRHEVQMDMLRFCQKAYAETPRGLIKMVNAALGEVEKDCLLHRAAAMRIGARELEREADYIEAEASRVAAAAMV